MASDRSKKAEKMLPDSGVGLAELAAALDMTRANVRLLVDKKVMPQDRRGRYDLHACTVAYIRHLRELSKGRAVNQGAATQRERIVRLKGDKLELEVAQLSKQLVPIDEVLECVRMENSMTKERLLLIPGTAASELVGLQAGEIETRLRKYVHEALEELHDPSYDGIRSRGAA